MPRIEEVIYHLRTGTPQQWASANPILDKGEPGLELLENGTYKVKFGDGVRRWDNLPYFASAASGGSDGSLEDHINSSTPHPAYDDGPSFALLYENAKV